MRTPGKSKRKNSRKNSGTSSQGQGALSQKPPTDSPSVDSSTTEDVPAAEELEAEIPGTEVPMSAQSVSDFMNGAFDATEPTDMHDDAVPDDAVTESMFNMTTKSGPSYDAYSDITTTVEEQSLGATPTAISESLFENTFATEKPNDEPSSPSIFTKLVEDFQSGISAIMSDSAFPAGEEEVMQTPVSQPQLASDTGLTTPFGLTGTKVVDDVVAKVSSDDGPGEERDGVAIALANEYAQEMLDDSVNSEDVNNSSTVTEIVSSQPKANYSKGHSNIKSQITSHLAKTIGGGGGGSPPRTVSALGSTSTPVAVSNTESAPTPASIDSERPRRKGGRIVAPNKAPKVVTKASRSRNTSIESLNGSASMEKPVVEEFSALSPASHGYSVNSGGATSVETDDNANAVTYNSRNSGMKSSSSAPTLSVQFHGNHRKVDGYDRIPDVPHNTPMKQSEPSPRRSPAVSNSHTPRGNRTPRKDTELLANTEYLMEDLMMIRPEAAEVPLALEHPDSPRRDWAQELREPQPMPALSSQVSPRVSSRRSPRAARQTVAAETETTPEPDTYSPSRAPSSSPLSASASASDTGLKRSGSAGSPAKRKPKGPLVSDPDFPALNSGIKPGVWPTSLSCVSKGGGMWSPEALVSPHFGLSGIKGMYERFPLTLSLYTTP